MEARIRLSFCPELLIRVFVVMLFMVICPDLGPWVRFGMSVDTFRVCLVEQSDAGELCGMGRTAAVFYALQHQA